MVRKRMPCDQKVDVCLDGLVCIFNSFVNVVCDDGYGNSSRVALQEEEEKDHRENNHLNFGGKNDRQHSLFAYDADE